MGWVSRTQGKEVVQRETTAHQTGTFPFLCLSPSRSLALTPGPWGPKGEVRPRPGSGGIQTLAGEEEGPHTWNLLKSGI